MRGRLAILTGAVLTAALAWGGWWWLGAGLRERAIEAWLAGRRADGWTAEAASIRRTGFPNRIDIIVDGLALADPEARWSWEAEEFQLLSLAYRPQEMVLAWPGEQLVTTPLDSLRLRGDVLRASARFEPNTRLALQRTSLEASDLQVKGGGGWTAAVADARVATRPAADGTAHGHDLSVAASGIALPDLLGEAAAGPLPRTLDRVSLDATLGFDRPWDRPAVEAGGAILRSVDVRGLEVAWGALRLEAEGRLAADAEGRAEGRLDLRARDWQTVLELARRSGLLDRDAASALRSGLGLLAALGGGRDEIDVALDFEDGRMRLGPLPLGPAPRLAPAPR